MQYQPDIVISDRFGAAVAIIEVKALVGTDAQVATRYLRNLLAHGIAPSARYILLITPDTGYLWLTPEAVLTESGPSLIFHMNRIVAHYLPPDDEAGPVRGLVLEAIVKLWLSDLADGTIVDEQVTRGLRESGFLDAVRDGRVTAQAFA